MAGAIFNTVPPLAAGAGMKFDGERISTAAAPRNLLDNTDFEIAQAGYGGKHGSVIYAADRWAQNDATARTYTKTYANGHGVIKCSAATRIQQKLYLTTGTAYTAAVTIGGVRTIITFSANGGSYGGNSLWVNHQSDGTYLFVITNIPADTIVSEPVLYGGTYTDDTLPEYQSKGIGAEMAECKRYYQLLQSNGATTPFHGYAESATEIRIIIPLAVAMRANPSVVITVARMCNYAGTAYTVKSITDIVHALGFCMLRIATESAAANASVYITVNKPIELCADL